jgi:hypothetical protein
MAAPLGAAFPSIEERRRREDEQACVGVEVVGFAGPHGHGVGGDDLVAAGVERGEPVRVRVGEPSTAT